VSLCECGCGRETLPAPRTNGCYGHVKGQPLRFIRGHSGGKASWWTSMEERFFAKVHFKPGCWGWLGPKDPNGYGRFSLGSARPSVLAHRVAYEIHNGPIPDGLYVCHHCDNPECTRPGHLFVGTPADNMRDMSAKGRRRNQFSPPR